MSNIKDLLAKGVHMLSQKKTATIKDLIIKYQGSNIQLICVNS